MDEEARGIHEEGNGMNARQKAKQLKKIAAEYKAEADAWRQYARTEAAKHHENAAKVKTIHFFKLVTREELEYIPEETIKRELATDIGQALLDANLIRWKTEDVPKMCCKRYAAVIYALKQEGEA